MIGNFIADHVKGNAFSLYSEGIQKGILLHRAIDAFTDEHPVVMQSKQRLRTEFHKYAPVIADVFYDHFLAKSWDQYHHQPLEEYVSNAYEFLKTNSDVFPEKATYMLGYMSSQNWLLNYREISGIARALGGLSRRTKFNSGMENAHLELERNYEFYSDEFNRFFPELRLFVAGINTAL